MILEILRSIFKRGVVRASGLSIKVYPITLLILRADDSILGFFLGTTLFGYLRFFMSEPKVSSAFFFIVIFIIINRFVIGGKIAIFDKRSQGISLLNHRIDRCLLEINFLFKIFDKLL
jgi:hypothetical protein